MPYRARTDIAPEGEKLTVRELISREIDIDVVDDYTEDLYIACCAPIRLTEEGERRFADVLGYEAELFPNICVIKVDTENEKETRIRLSQAQLFFEAAAGYCPVSNYEKWFIE